MFPSFEILWITVYMTWIWIITFLICFICIAFALCKKRHQDFYLLFYQIPFALVITYLMWKYVHFFLNVWIIPTTKAEIISLLSPYGYTFHFVWLLIWFIISLIIFFSKIKRYENKQIRIDIFFFSTAISLIPLGIFLAFWDNFIGQYNTGRLSVKPLTTDSELNKFWSVYPVWLFLSVISIIVVWIWWIMEAKNKSFWSGIRWFILLIFGINIVFFFQQYPKYWVYSLHWITFDIKQYISIFAILFCLAVYFKRKNNTKHINQQNDNQNLQ